MHSRTWRSAPVHIRTRIEGLDLIVTPEPPAGDSTVFTSLKAVVRRCEHDYESVVFDMGRYRRISSHNIACVVILRDLFRQRGIERFHLINYPAGAPQQLEGLGLEDLIGALA